MDSRLKCKCGGLVWFEEEQTALVHTSPHCQAFTDLNLEELLKTDGAFFKAFSKLLDNPEA